MSISDVLSSSVSALRLNAQKLASVADNVANARTPGYKAGSVEGATLVTRQTSDTRYTAGGVQGHSRAQVTGQGLLQATSSATDLGISGQGLLPVRDAGGTTVYTRTGAFRPDAEGYLADAAGNRLLGRATDADGAVTGTALEPINVDRLAGGAEASTRLGLGANLPADAAPGTRQEITVDLRDSVGNTLRTRLSFEQQGDNRYRLTIGDPTTTDGTPAGTAERADGGAYDVGVRFDGSGHVAGFDLSGDGTVDSATPPDLAVRGLTTGGEDLRVAVDLADLTQLAGPGQTDYVAADGAAYGAPAGVSVERDGTVTAQYDNGTRRPVYRVPVATFANPDGLEALSGTTYRATSAAGEAVLRTAGEGGAGGIEAATLEQSTTDLGTETVRSIVASTAYRASLQTLQAADEMQRELLDTKA